MSVLTPECNQNELSIEFILISSLNSHISRVVKLHVWSLNPTPINLIILAGGFHLRFLVSKRDCILKRRLITSFQYAWKSCFFCHNLEIKHFYYYCLKKENVQEEFPHIATLFIPFYFINKYKRILIMEVNLWVLVLIANPHNCKTIKWKQQKEWKLQFV